MAQRDRHGKGLRRPLLPPSLPAYRTRSQVFDDAVAGVAHRIESRWPKEMASVEVGVESVPPSDPAPWEDGIPVSRLFPAEAGQPSRIVLYRQPLERRVESDSLQAIIRDVLADNLAHLWGKSPHQIDPEYGEP